VVFRELAGEGSGVERQVGGTGIHAAASESVIARASAVWQGPPVGRRIPNAPRPAGSGRRAPTSAELRWTEPTAELLLTRAVDFVPDGVCTGTTFNPLPLPNPGPLVLLTTSPAAAGAKHASFAFTPPPPPPAFADGQQFDVHWEIRTANGFTLLRSPCITVTVR
jgi:hypothetical protein